MCLCPFLLLGFPQTSRQGKPKFIKHLLIFQEPSLMLFTIRFQLSPQSPMKFVISPPLNSTQRSWLLARLNKVQKVTLLIRANLFSESRSVWLQKLTPLCLATSRNNQSYLLGLLLCPRQNSTATAPFEARHILLRKLRLKGLNSSPKDTQLWSSRGRTQISCLHSMFVLSQHKVAEIKFFPSPHWTLWGSATYAHWLECFYCNSEFTILWQRRKFLCLLQKRTDLANEEWKKKIIGCPWHKQGIFSYKTHASENCIHLKKRFPRTYWEGLQGASFSSWLRVYELLISGADEAAQALPHRWKSPNSEHSSSPLWCIQPPICCTGGDHILKAVPGGS